MATPAKDAIRSLYVSLARAEAPGAMTSLSTTAQFTTPASTTGCGQLHKPADSDLLQGCVKRTGGDPIALGRQCGTEHGLAIVTRRSRRIPQQFDFRTATERATRKRRRSGRPE
jgi:hypothetical protein